MELPEPWNAEYHLRCVAIRERLSEFTRISNNQLFYELAFCILTPQSSQANAEKVVRKLQEGDFLGEGFDPVPYLRNPEHYIRFHNVKAHRLLSLRESFGAVKELLDTSASVSEKREELQKLVSGIGLKEASHFLRNIGEKDLAILDRHILKHLYRLGIISEIPKNAPTRKQYLKIERDWLAYAEQVGIPLDELDLLFWSIETGEIKK